VLRKIDQEERKILVGTMQHLIHSIDNIEDEDLKEKICHEIIGLCDQMKSRMVVSMVKDKQTGNIIYETKLSD